MLKEDEKKSVTRDTVIDNTCAVTEFDPQKDYLVGARMSRDTDSYHKTINSSGKGLVAGGRSRAASIQTIFVN